MEPESAEIVQPEAEVDDNFAVVVAVLIAIVTLVGGLIGWRAVISSGEAGGAESAGLAAALNVEQTRILNEAALYRHYRAYSGYARDLSLSADGADPARESLSDTSRLFFPARYLNRDGSYARARELEETWAQAAQSLDLDPDSSFETADHYWDKTRWLIAMLAVTTLSLFCYTLAESLHIERTRLRYASFALGTLTLTIASAGTIAIERML